jgi:hypothetical protein
VDPKKLVPRATRLGRLAAKALRSEARELRGLLKVDPSVRERLLHVGREVDNWQILPDEAVQRYTPGCFTLEYDPEVAGGAQQVLTSPARGATALSVSRRAALDVSDGVEKSD